jgi:VWFA-related protein
MAGAVETSLVEIDAFVIDRDGKPVRGLGAADFEVRVGGRPAEIAGASETASTAAAPELAPQAAEPPRSPAEEPSRPFVPVSRPPRHIVLFLDRLELPDKIDAKGTFEALRELLRAAMGPGDAASIVSWDRRAKTLVPFTADAVTLDRALEAEMQRSFRPSEEEQTRDRLQDEFAASATPPQGAGGAAGEEARSFTKRVAAAEAYARIRAKAGALRAVIATLGGLPGRRVLVFASQRFSLLAGLEFFLDRRSGPDLPANAREFNTRGFVDSVIEAANANGVVLYPFFPTGYTGGRLFPVSAADRPTSYPRIQSGVMGADAATRVMNETAALGPLAEQTGGRLAVGPVGARESVAGILGDLDHAYVLAVHLPPGRLGASLSVSVRAKDRRLTVRSKRSLVLKSAEDRVRDRVLSNLFRPDGASRIALSLAEAARVEVASGKRLVTIPLRIPFENLAGVPSARGRTVSVTFFVAVSGADGSFSEVLTQKKSFEIPREDLDRARRGAFTYRLPVAIGLGDGRISVGVFDDVGRDAGFLLLEIEGAGAVRLQSMGRPGVARVLLHRVA